MRITFIKCGGLCAIVGPNFEPTDSESSLRINLHGIKSSLKVFLGPFFREKDPSAFPISPSGIKMTASTLFDIIYGIK